MNDQNLTPFQPGQSGNPAGRPVGSKNMSTILKEMLDEEVDFEGEKTPLKNIIVTKLIRKGKASNLKAIQEIFDRTEGKAKQEMKIEHSPKGFINLDPFNDSEDNSAKQDSQT